MNIFSLENRECIKFVRGFRSSTKFLAAFRSSYDSIIVYHGTNLSEQESQEIKLHGLVRASVDVLKKKAKDRFISRQDKEYLRKNISIAVEKFFEKSTLITEGRIYFTLDSAILQDKAYHYILLGPETLHSLADQLKNDFGINFRVRMSEYGRPIIVKALLPAINTMDSYLEGIFWHVKKGFPECCITGV